MKSFLDNLQSSGNTLKVPMSSAEGTRVPLGTSQNDRHGAEACLLCFSLSLLAMGKETQRFYLWETWPVLLSQGTTTHGKTEAITPCA